MCDFIKYRLRDPLLGLSLVLIAVVMALIALPAQAQVDACSFKPAPAPDYRNKGPLYMAPDVFTPDQRKTA